jgi:hypothetical protein
MPDASTKPPPAEAKEDDVAAGMGNVENRREAETTADAPATTAENENDEDDDEDARCPICAFVSAGPCVDTHRAWSQCRKQNKEDFVEACKPKFVEFFRCMTSTPESREYHKPLLRAFGAPPGILGEEEEGEEEEGGGDERKEGEGRDAAAAAGSGAEEARRAGDGGGEEKT